MQPTSIARGAAALTLAGVLGAAQAQAPGPAGSSVTMYGLIDVSAGSFTGAATGVNRNDKKVRQVMNGAMSTSHFGLRGSEDLGNGLSAQFELSSFIRVDTGTPGRSDAIAALGVAADPFWSRQSWVGLSSRTLGRLRLGNSTTPMFLAALMSNAFGDSTVFSPLMLVTFIGSPLSGGTGWTNQIAYDSPVIGGLSLAAAVSASENQGGRNVGARASYAAGPATVSLSMQKVEKNPATFADGTSPNNTSSWLLAGGWNFGFMRAWAHLGRIANKGTEAAPLNITYKIWDVSAAVPMGAGSLLAGYAVRSTGDTVGPVPATVAGGNVERKVMTVGYDYFLSKRTDVYLMLSRDQTRTRTLPAPPTVLDASGTNIAAGVRHRF